jgi:hypothetical protein
MGAGGSPSPVPADRRPTSHVTVPPRLDAPKAESGGMASADARVAQFRVEERGRTTWWGPRACSRLSRSSIPPGEALAAARSLLRHPPLRARAGTPEGEWLDELANLVRRDALGSRVQNSCATSGAPSAQPQGPAARTGRVSDLRSRLNDMRAREDGRTSLERARVRRRQAEDEQASSGLPTGNGTIFDDGISPYGAGC